MQIVAFGSPSSGKTRALTIKVFISDSHLISYNFYEIIRLKLKRIIIMNH